MRGTAVLAAVVVSLIAVVSMADRTSVVYVPGDGGSAAVPILTGRKAVEMFNADSVAVCVVVGGTATPTAPCRPIVPGGSMSIDANDSKTFSIRKCSSTTVASCLGDGGVTVTEIQ
jgi:Na+-transporting NADH:ubiquinone oxidoreductase subunit NqrF